MKEERYNLVCKGELLPGFEQSVVVPQLAKIFKVDETRANKLLDKKPRVIMKQLSWQQAVKYSKKLKNLGLVNYVNLVFDADIFRENLLPVTDLSYENQTIADESVESHSFAGASLQRLSIDSTKLAPLMFAKPHTEVVFDNNNKSKYYLESYNHWLNPKFLFIASAFTALIVQKYFGLLLVQATTSPIVTPLLIILFFLVTIFLPKVMSPRRIFTLRNTVDNSGYLMSAQIPGLNPFINAYYIYSSDGEILAYVKLNNLKNKIECYDVDGNIIYTSSEEHYVDDVAKDAAADIRDELFDFSVLYYFKILTERLKKLESWFKKEKAEYHRSDAFVIRDKNGNKVAFFDREKSSTIEYPVVADKGNENKTLLAFLIICIGVV